MNEQARELMKTMDRIKKLHQQKMDMDGLNKGEFVMLMSIREYRNICVTENGEDLGVNISELSKLHKISMPAISQMLNNLEKKGLAERKAGLTDRRVVRVYMTSQGEAAVEAANEKFLKFTLLVLERLGAEDTQKMIDLFNKLYDIIQEMQDIDLPK